MKRVSLFFAVLSCGLSSTGVAGQDRLFVDITEGALEPLAVGVPEIASGTSLPGFANGDAGEMLARVVSNDLATSPFFRIVPPEGTEPSDDMELINSFARKEAQGLVIGRPSLTSSGSLRYSCSFYDVFSKNLEISREFDVPVNAWRRAGHKCADMVFMHATGYPGHFDTRFTMTSGTGSEGGPRTSIVAVDFDGESRVQLLSRDQLIAMPRTSPDGSMLVLIAYASGRPALVVHRLDTATTSVLRLPPGVPSAPRFSPSNTHIVFALSDSSDSNIFEYELSTAKITQLTDTTGIDTSPAYSPDGSKIAFESDRSGNPQIYVMRRDGSEQRRITFEDANGSPVWSPLGDRIAFVSYSAGMSRIATSEVNGTGVRVVTSGPHDEDPSWARSGRALSFQRTLQGAETSTLWVSDVSGRREFQVGISSSVAEPQWSEYAE